ncbi:MULTISPECIES: DUF4465 domain-containing protein [Myroides]|uniref:DUF4465 domain-containing protein n=1 Tax=Myroides albus TaxID=2562892 RepID=A0A6I3LSC1_9FLAO|nr:MULTISPECIES: DUF4465 domain-containing protein [Myroides]MTG99002.1 DUF4465 domain-containing protein [Myroides albus]MVX35764.1 DUF4465 domain-containing protein [Myroides sp. LoEW2-1]UVD78247.1 DUF4465 domain-containing protein [Myroides albus]
MKLRFLRTSLLFILGLTITTTVFTSCSSDDNSNDVIYIQEEKVNAEAREEFTIDPKIDPTGLTFKWFNNTTQKELSDSPVLTYKMDFAKTESITLKTTNKEGVINLYNYAVTSFYGENYNVLDLKEIPLQIEVKDGYIWDGTYTDGAKIESNNFLFSHSVTEFGDAKYWNGFIASNSIDKTDHETNFAQNMHGTMANTIKDKETIPFLVAYTEGAEKTYTKGEVIDIEKTATVVTLQGEDSSELVPVEINLGLSPYTYYSITNGDSFAKKFEKGDYFSVVIYLLDENKKVLNEKPIEQKLVNFKKDGDTITKDWQKIQFKDKKAAKYIVFYVDSSDKGEYGINTPALFTIKDIVAHKKAVK